MTNTQSHIGGAEMHTEEIKMLKALASIAPSHVKEALEAGIKALEVQPDLVQALECLRNKSLDLEVYELANEVKLANAALKKAGVQS